MDHREQARHGQPAQDAPAASASTTGAQPGQADGELVEEALVQTVTPGTAAGQRGKLRRLGVVELARRRSRLRQEGEMDRKASAHRPALVQMLEVAFSRLMCCSRRRERQHEAALSGGIDGSPTSRPASGACTLFGGDRPT